MGEKPSLDAERHAHAAADAKRSEAFLGVALLHFEEQRVEHACTEAPTG
jgi:hypothetical protein